jgi:hypothetical protein
MAQIAVNISKVVKSAFRKLKQTLKQPLGGINVSVRKNENSI